MIFLRITAVDGTRRHFPDNYTLNINTAADTSDTSSAMAVGKPIRGKITSVKYFDGTVGTAGAIVVDTVAAYNGANTLYEYGDLTPDGAFTEYLSNK